MAKREIECAVTFDKLFTAIKNNNFAPLYVMMGSEPYYGDLIAQEIKERALSPHEVDFNYLLLYGSSSSASSIIEAARRYPVMATRQVIVVKEAQLISDQELFEHYFESPLASTILLLIYNGKSVDKRTKLYKLAQKNGVIHEGFPLLPDMVHQWLENYLKGKGYNIAPDAAMLMADYCGTQMRKLVLESDKLIAFLGESKKVIEIKDVEQNSGISREFSTFELAGAIMRGERAKAFKIINHFAHSPKQYPLVVTLATLFYQFSTLLKYHAYIKKEPNASLSNIATNIKVNPYFIRDYQKAAIRYPLLKCMSAISLIRRYDSLGKSSQRGEASDGDLLFEMVFKIMN